MSSLNVESGYPLAKIIGKGSLNNKIIRIDDKSKVKQDFKELTLDENYDFQVIPNIDAERSTIYVCGMAGSGKSYFVSGWIKEYVKFYPNNPIYIFSEKEYDEQLDKIKNTKRIKLSEELKEINYLEFSNSCCLFDDIDSLDKNIKNVVYAIRDKALKLGRSAKISVVCTAHNATDGKESKVLLNESQSIVFFMANWNRSLKYVVENYLGMTKEDVKKAKSNNSRWTCYTKSYPNIIIQQKNIFIAGQNIIERIKENFKNLINNNDDKIKAKKSL